MKILIFLLLPITLFSQQLSGFENIPFASSKEIVRDSMSLIKDIKLGYVKEDVLGFNGGEYISQEVNFWAFHFYNDRLHTVDIVFIRTFDLNQLRRDIIDYITEKYGVESSERYDDDGNLANTWYFVDSRHNPTDLINLILYETAKGETTYQLTFVNIRLFEGSEQNNEQGKE